MRFRGPTTLTPRDPQVALERADLLAHAARADLAAVAPQFDFWSGTIVVERVEVPMSHVCISDDGSLIANGNTTGRVEVWSMQTRELLRVLKGSGSTRAVAIAPNGRWLAVSREFGPPNVVALLKGKPHQLSGKHDGRVSAGRSSISKRVGRWPSVATDLSFAADSDTLVASYGKGPALEWGLRDLTVRSCLPPGAIGVRGVLAVCCLRGGGLAVLGCEQGTVEAWTATSRKLMWRAQKHAWPVLRVVCCPSGLRGLSIAGDGSVRLWNPHNGEDLGGVADPAGCASAGCFLHDGRGLAVGNYSGQINVWSGPNLRRTAGWQAHRGKVTALVSGPQGVLCSVGEDGRMCLWMRTEDGASERPLAVAP